MVLVLKFDFALNFYAFSDVVWHVKLLWVRLESIFASQPSPDSIGVFTVRVHVGL